MTNCETLLALYRKMISDNLKAVFSNAEIALRVFMSMMATNCAGERSFSRLKKTASKHIEAAAFELAFTHAYEK